MASRIEMVAAYERYCAESGREPSSESRRAFYRGFAAAKVAELQRRIDQERRAS